MFKINAMRANKTLMKFETMGGEVSKMHHFTKYPIDWLCQINLFHE